jgi:hypothetical protein
VQGFGGGKAIPENDDRYSSIAHLKAIGTWGVPKVEALFDATLFAGLRKAGIPEE